ncbi:MAG: PEGA domain-containing protein [Candidatus Saccharimonas sp.]
MHYQKNKRKKRAQLVFIYTLMVISVFAIVSVLVMVVLGYRFNRYDGKVEQGGLVQFDSRPTGATVTIDGITLASKTTSKITASTGKHTVTIAKPGYQPWQKQVTVLPGSVLWLNYALLLQQNAPERTLLTVPALTSSVVSPDYRYLAFVAEASSPVIHVVSLNSDTPQVDKVTIPSSILTVSSDPGARSQFSVQSWDKDGRHVLVRHTYSDTGSELLSVPLRGGDAPYNVTRSLGVTIDRADYALDDSNTVIVLTNTHEIREANIANNTLSGPLITNVADFSYCERSTICYTTLPSASGVRLAGYYSRGASVPRTVRTSTSSTTTPVQPLAVTTGKYFGEHYIVTVDGDTMTIQKGTIPASDTGKLTLVTVATVPLHMSGGQPQFSPDDSRFIMVQAGEKIVVYDLELLQVSRITLPAAPALPVQWIDNHHWAAVVNGIATYYDFDGTNAAAFHAQAAAQSVALSENKKYLYAFYNSAAGVQLVRVTRAN